MRVLVACEYSGRVRDAFIARGHETLSCDILPSDTPGPHYQGDVFDVLYAGWDLLIAFPPCTNIASVGAAQWTQKRLNGAQYVALSFARRLADAPIERIAIENPIGRLGTTWRKADQIINPWMFGDPWDKKTCLWLKNTPPLVATKIVKAKGPWVDGGSTTKRGLPRSSEGSYEGAVSKSDADRAHVRSKTFQGIADAMASQWG